MDTVSITGCWTGALLSDQGGAALPFFLNQPARGLGVASGPTFRVGSEPSTTARLLDGASRAIVALLDDTRDPASGQLAQLLVDARVRGNQLVGRWWRRDETGQVLGSGALSAERCE